MKENLFKHVGWLGLGLLMVAPLLQGREMRMIWFMSGIPLLIHSIKHRDWVMICVNTWITLVNGYMLWLL